MADIKLFVCCHQRFEVPKHPLLVPIQVGAALAKHHFDGFQHDDFGDSISEKNRSYCELTAQYWAWKNMDADYYGFFHYRRYLYPDTNAKRPYRIEGDPSEELLKSLNFDRIEALIPQYDLIAPMGENMHISVQEHYADAKHHRRKDLTLIEEIIREKNPECVPAMEQYLNGVTCYFGNIYVMSKEIFRDYCAWLFPILEEFDRRADLTNYGPQELRVDGYLAERLFGVYYTMRKDALSALELPRVHFMQDVAARRKQKLINVLLPPGSTRRAWIKQMIQR